MIHVLQDKWLFVLFPAPSKLLGGIILLLLTLWWVTSFYRKNELLAPFWQLAPLPEFIALPPQVFEKADPILYKLLLVELA